MSSCDEYTLEFFVRDSFFGPITDDQLDKIVRLLEPERDRIEENMISDFDEDCMSWRSYRNSMWDTIDPSYEKRIDVIMRSS
jgi:hypothetical protein